MLDRLKELWQRWRVQVTVVGEVLVVATAYGTCSYEPPTEEEVVEESAEEASAETTESTEAAEAAETTEATETTESAEAAE